MVLTSATLGRDCFTNWPELVGHSAGTWTKQEWLASTWIWNPGAFRYGCNLMCRMRL